MIWMGTIYFCELSVAAIVAAMKSESGLHEGPLNNSLYQLGLVALVALLATGCAAPHQSPTGGGRWQALTPAKALETLEAGNARFAEGRSLPRNWPQERAATASGQHPFAVVLSCIDSRTSSEIIFDQGLGDIFNARIAGNVLTDEILGSLEFACKVAGAKLIVVAGHTRCGAINGACTGAQLGHLTGLLEHIQPAIAETAGELPGVKPTDPHFAELVTAANVRLGLRQIRERSPTLRAMIDAGDVMLVGAIYDLDSGRVQFFNH